MILSGFIKASVYILIFFLGASLGSFIATVINRVDSNRSIFKPSICDDCGKKLSGFDLIPVLSFMFYKGRCSSCNAKIPSLNFIIEIISGIYSLLFFSLFGYSPHFFKLLIFYMFALPIAYIDATHYIIKNELVLIGGIFIICFTLFFDTGNALNSLLGGLAGFMFFLVIFLIFRGKLGFGDVKLLAFLGLFAGLKGILTVIFLGSFLGILYALTWMLIKHKTFRKKIPFAPFLCFGTFLYLLLNKYLHILINKIY